MIGYEREGLAERIARVWAMTLLFAAYGALLGTVWSAAFPGGGARGVIWGAVSAGGVTLTFMLVLSRYAAQGYMLVWSPIVLIIGIIGLIVWAL